MTRSLAVLGVPWLLGLAACFKPISGDYSLELVEESSDCPEDTGADTGGEEEDTTVPVAVNEDKSTMVIGDDTFSYDCPLDGRSFSCPTDPLEFDLSMYDVDAVVKTTFDIYGDWTGNDAFDLHVDYDITCSGADCESSGVTTCSGSGTSEATLVSE